MELLPVCCCPAQQQHKLEESTAYEHTSAHSRKVRGRISGYFSTGFYLKYIGSACSQRKGSSCSRKGRLLSGTRQVLYERQLSSRFVNLIVRDSTCSGRRAGRFLPRHQLDFISLTCSVVVSAWAWRNRVWERLEIVADAWRFRCRKT